MRRCLWPLLAVGALGVFRPAQAEPAAAPPTLPPGVSASLYQLASPNGPPPPAKVKLGEKLFNEKRLSVDDSTSCATCHEADRGFVDHKKVSEGVRKQKGTRNAPTILNAMFQATQFWDGRAATLEDQAKLPILNPVEMAQKSPEDVVAKVRKIPEYADAFRVVYGRDVTYDDLADAIGAFERTLYSGNSPFDRYLAGDEKAIGPAARRGWALFNGKARCNSCHAANIVSPLFSDQKFHNIGIAAHDKSFPTLAREALKVVESGNQEQIDRLALETEFSEVGRFLVTRNYKDVGAFKTETLRNIGITAPYMHDGSMDTLFDVLDHYNKGGVPNPYLDGGMQRLGLTERELGDLFEFLFTLTDQRFARFNAQERRRQLARRNVRPQRDTAVALGKKGNLGDLAPNPTLKDPANIGVYGITH